MLAVLTSNHITITDRSALQKGPPTLTPTCPVPLSSYVASVWSPDNTSLYQLVNGVSFVPFVSELELESQI
jgi:hypothetical protein